ncbi:MAG: hypothetical protein KDK37_18155 [Leptospiraceae bacterium]|nr:hypothetical protein [Leptospiraceae bacterium]
MKRPIYFLLPVLVATAISCMHSMEGFHGDHQYFWMGTGDYIERPTQLDRPATGDFKESRACGWAIGLVGSWTWGWGYTYGDTSIAAALEGSNIDSIVSVEHELKAVPLFAIYCTIIRGY